MDRACIFDTETTGLVGNSALDLKHQPFMIEFYGCIVNTEGEIIDELEFLCNPGIKLDPVITRITGLTDDDLKGQPTFAEKASELISFIESADGIVAHNLSFDYDIISFDLKRCSRELKWPLARICTVEETEWIKGYRLNLKSLHEHLFSEDFEDAHRAKHDVMALVRCFNELRERGDL